MSFSSIIANFERKSLEQADQIRRAAILKLFGMIVTATPVDEGLLRGNWQTNTTAPKLSPIELRPEAAVTEEIKANLGTLKDSVFFSNSLPYANRIEYEGWSAFAKDGMVRSNVVHWERIVKDVAKSIK